MALPNSLDILIAGAGIAGLAAAAALRRAGHTVHVYERSALAHEVGAAIMVPPNAGRPLLAWGMDPRRARLVRASSVFRARGDSLDVLHEESFDGYEEKYGAPLLLSHRVDLHAELWDLAVGRREGEVEKEAGYGKVQVYLGKEVVAMDTEAPSLTLADGTVVHGDIVVVADGVHSLGVEKVLGKANPPQPQDLYNFCYRFLIPKKDIEADPKTKDWTKNDDGRVKFYLGDNKRIASYPCRDGQIHNFTAIFHHEDCSSVNAEDWQAPVEKAKLLEKYADFHPRVLAILDKATEIKQWPLLYRAPMPTWTKGKVVLTGDAAHPMLPHQGQGGGQAIEDGVALGIALIGVTDRAQVIERLAAYEKIRRIRGSVLQVFSNAGQDEPELIQREAVRFIPVEQIPKNPAEFHVYNMGYDIVGDSVRVLRETVPDFSLPKNFFSFPGRGGYEGLHLAS